MPENAVRKKKYLIFFNNLSFLRNNTFLSKPMPIENFQNAVFLKHQYHFCATSDRSTNFWRIMHNIYTYFKQNCCFNLPNIDRRIVRKTNASSHSFCINLPPEVFRCASHYSSTATLSSVLSSTQGVRSTLAQWTFRMMSTTSHNRSWNTRLLQNPS